MYFAIWGVADKNERSSHRKKTIRRNIHESTHSSDADLVTDKNVMTARANAYVDFAVEVAKKLNMFASEADLQETINFWKHYQKVQ